MSGLFCPPLKCFFKILNLFIFFQMHQVGSKIDKAASRAVQYEEGVELAKRFGAMFVEVSSKTRENVRRPFVDVVDKIVETPELLNARRGLGDNTVQVGGEGAQGSSNGCAC